MSVSTAQLLRIRQQREQARADYLDSFSRPQKASNAINSNVAETLTSAGETFTTTSPATNKTPDVAASEPIDDSPATLLPPISLIGDYEFYNFGGLSLSVIQQSLKLNVEDTATLLAGKLSPAPADWCKAVAHIICTPTPAKVTARDWLALQLVSLDFLANHVVEAVECGLTIRDAFTIHKRAPSVRYEDRGFLISASFTWPGRVVQVGRNGVAAVTTKGKRWILRKPAFNMWGSGEKCLAWELPAIETKQPN